MKKILLVEDEPAFVKLLQAELGAKGYDVDVALNGEEGLKKAKENPDLVLLDIRMPVMDGITMLQRLRNEKFGKDIKVMILTNYEPDELLKQKISDCFAPLIIKSNTKLKSVVAKIEEILK